MSKSYQVAVVGARAVGQEMVRVLRQRRFPANCLRVLARSERLLSVNGETFQVEQARPEAFEGVQVALFAGGETAKDHLGWEAVRRGALVIDNSSAFRLYPNVPLVVPEVNPETLRSHQGLIANPNCSTIQMVVALGPLHRRARIKRVVVCTYQAVSGKGQEGIDQLEAELRAAYGDGQPAAPSAFGYPIAGNVLPHIDSFNQQGDTKEELKLLYETRKILGDDSIQVTATAVRVPVVNGHSEAVNVEFHSPIGPEEARELLSKAPGVMVVDDPANSRYPTPIEASGRDQVLVGRIRKDPTVSHGLNLWVVADNLRKGAALNAVQIAEKMAEMGLL